jgi:hypothetical protein
MTVTNTATTTPTSGTTVTAINMTATTMATVAAIFATGGRGSDRDEHDGHGHDVLDHSYYRHNYGHHDHIHSAQPPMLHQLRDTVADYDGSGMRQRCDPLPFLCRLDFKVADDDNYDGTASHLAMRRSTLPPR